MVDFGFGGSLSLFDEFKSKDSDLCRANIDLHFKTIQLGLTCLTCLNMVQSCSFSCSIFGQSSVISQVGRTHQAEDETCDRANRRWKLSMFNLLFWGISHLFCQCLVLVQWDVFQCILPATVLVKNVKSWLKEEPWFHSCHLWDTEQGDMWLPNWKRDNLIHPHTINIYKPTVTVRSQ